MSLEQQIADLSASMQDLTQAIIASSNGGVGNVPVQPTTAQPASAIPPNPVAPAPVAQPVAVPPTPAVVATPAVASPSEQPAMTLPQLQQEVTALWQATQNPAITAIVAEYGKDLTHIDPANFGPLIQRLRALG